MLLQDGDTFVDIGANVGLYSAVLSRQKILGPTTRFYAFEPNTETYRRLLETIEGTGVMARNVALSDHSGIADFVDGAVSHVFTSVDTASAYSIPGEVRKVTCARLDDCEVDGDSLVLKIDVEGQESRVLLGAEKLFAADRVKAVYCDGVAGDHVKSFLQGHGFKFFDGRTLKPSDGDVFSLLAIKPSRFPRSALCE